MDPTSGTPFQFCGRRRDRIKALFREPDGFVLIYKRLSVQGDTNGPGSSQKSGIFPGESLTGWCQESISISPKHSKQSKKIWIPVKILHRKIVDFPINSAFFNPCFLLGQLYFWYNKGIKFKEKTMASSAKDIQILELRDTITQLRAMIPGQTELIRFLRLVIDKKQPWKSPSGTGGLSCQKAFRFLQRKESRWYSMTTAPFWWSGSGTELSQLEEDIVIWEHTCNLWGSFSRPGG